MPIPKIELRYSGVYDNRYRQVYERFAQKGSRPYPTPKQLLRFIGKVGPEWRRIEQKVLRELARVTKLPWKEKVISCYVVGRCRSFSDPLTISATNLAVRFIDTSNFIDILIHELIHRIFTQAGNERLMLPARNYIAKTYKHETRSMRVHVLVHAVHAHIYLALFSRRRLQRDIDRCQPYPDYRRAWEIVQAEGHGSIISRINRGFRK